jgi:hypothetical protein
VFLGWRRSPAVRDRHSSPAFFRNIRNADAVSWGDWCRASLWKSRLVAVGGVSQSLLGPAVVEDDFDEIVTNERRVEVFEHIGIDVAEGAARAVLVAIGDNPRTRGDQVGAGGGVGDRSRDQIGEVANTLPLSGATAPQRRRRADHWARHANSRAVHFAQTGPCSDNPAT